MELAVQAREIPFARRLLTPALDVLTWDAQAVQYLEALERVMNSLEALDAQLPDFMTWHAAWFQAWLNERIAVEQHLAAADGERLHGYGGDERDSDMPEAQWPKQTTATVRATAITIGFSENRYLHTEEGTRRTFRGRDCWAQADEYLRLAALVDAPARGYDKTDFLVHFEDGRCYSGRIDLQLRHAWMPEVLGQHMRETVIILGNLCRPAGIDDEEWAYLTADSERNGQAAEAREWFEKYALGGLGAEPGVEPGASIYASAAGALPASRAAALEL